MAHVAQKNNTISITPPKKGRSERSLYVVGNYPRSAFVSGFLDGLTAPSIIHSSPSYGQHYSKNGLRRDFIKVGSDIRVALRKYSLGDIIEKAKTS